MQTEQQALQEQERKRLLPAPEQDDTSALDLVNETFDLILINATEERKRDIAALLNRFHIRLHSQIKQRIIDVVHAAVAKELERRKDKPLIRYDLDWIKADTAQGWLEQKIKATGATRVAVVSDDDICELANYIADYVFHTDTSVIKTPKLERGLNIIENSLGIRPTAPVMSQARTDYNIGEPRFWRRIIRKTARKERERICYELNVVGQSTGQMFCSNLAVFERTEQNARNLETLSKLEIVRREERFCVLDIMRTKDARVAELRTLISGIEYLEHLKESVFAMVSVTAPPEFHPNPILGKNSWNGSLPDQAYRYLMRGWNAAQKDFNKAKIEFAGLRVTEPQQDGTPHFHYALWYSKNDEKAVEAIFRKHFGQNKVACDFKTPDASHSAVNYILTYAQKSLEGDTRVDAWNSVWNLRQFQFFGINSAITVWRECRRAVQQGKRITDPLAKLLTQAADEGDGAGFLTLFKKYRQSIKICYRKVRHMRTQEVSKKIYGIKIGSDKLRTHSKKWQLVFDKSDTQARSNLQSITALAIDDIDCESYSQYPKETASDSFLDESESFLIAQSDLEYETRYGEVPF